jgi:hypothetical protein
LLTDSFSRSISVGSGLPKSVIIQVAALRKAQHKIVADGREAKS